MKTRPFSALFAFVLLAAGSAWAHHNMSAMFDFNQVVTRTGTLAELDWRNPHIYMLVDVEDGGKVERWSFEGPPPGFFRQRNVDRPAFERRPHRPREHADVAKNRVDPSDARAVQRRRVGPGLEW